MPEIMLYCRCIARRLWETCMSVRITREEVSRRALAQGRHLVGSPIVDVLDRRRRRIYILGWLAVEAGGDGRELAAPVAERLPRHLPVGRVDDHPVQFAALPTPASAAGNEHLLQTREELEMNASSLHHLPQPGRARHRTVA